MTELASDIPHRSLLSDTLATKLDEAAVILRASVGDRSPLLSRLEALRARLRHQQLQLAIVGQFKRGKSSLINALLGVPLLPVAVVPLTAAPIFISWSPDPLVRISFKGSRPAEQVALGEADAIRDVLFRFVAEEANPKNRLDVERVDLCYPARILSGGTVLIDTPGIGSTRRHNTEAAFKVVPESDAVLFVVSADPPLTDTELDYLRQLKSITPQIFFVLNKVDYLTSSERPRAVGYLQTILRENDFLAADKDIFCVSARSGLAAKESKDERQWAASGMKDVEAQLVSFLATEKTRALQAAIRAKTVNIVSAAESQIRLHLKALQTPVEDLTKKLSAFEDALTSIEGQRRTMQDLLTGEQRRLRAALEERIVGLRRDVQAKVTDMVDLAIQNDPQHWEALVRRTVGARMEEAFVAEQQKFLASFAKMTDATLMAHHARFQGLIRVVQETAAQIFNVSFATDSQPEALQLGREPYWVTEAVKANLIPNPDRLIDRMLPGSMRRKRRRDRILGQMGELVIRNAENLRWALWRGLDETFRKAGMQLEEQLTTAMVATQGVIKDALMARRRASATLEPEISRLSRAIGSLSVMRATLEGVDLVP